MRMMSKHVFFLFADSKFPVPHDFNWRTEFVRTIVRSKRIQTMKSFSNHIMSLISVVRSKRRFENGANIFDKD